MKAIVGRGEKIVESFGKILQLCCIMGRYARLQCRPRPAHFRKEKKQVTIDVDWNALATAGVPEGMAIDPTSVKNLQTLTLSSGDINSVAIGKNFVLATGSG